MELLLLYTTLVLVVFIGCCRVLKSIANLVLEVTREGMRIRSVRNFRDVTEKEGYAFIYGTIGPQLSRKFKSEKSEKVTL